MAPDKNEISTWFRELQLCICAGLEAEDGTGVFTEDSWERPGGGGGRSRILLKGSCLEKAGVNFSAVSGAMPEFLTEQLKKDNPGDSFYASGVSIVIHPSNPHVPIIHMNVRYFEAGENVYWFGGGIDLTPHYVDAAAAAFFHTWLKKTCDRFDEVYYPEFKKWADDYFFIRHRNETRGIGGIFFDHLKESEKHSKQDRWNFVKAVGESFLPIYKEMMQRFRNFEYGPGEQEWQRLRRGRYVEFNLVYDRGTRFGIETQGRTESILMSLPPLAAWDYDFKPEPGSREEQTLSFLKKGIDWINTI